MHSRSIPETAKTSSEAPATTPKPAPTKSSISRTRAPRRAVNHVARFEAVEDDPLGPLGDNFDNGTEGTPRNDQPPEPPRKEVSPRSARVGPMSSGTRRIGDMMESVTLDDEVDDDEIAGRRGGARNPPPVALPGPTPQRAIPPSVPVEEAAKVSFDIAVGDPHKVGDLTSAHIVYSVRTKTTSKAYRQPEFQVTRRYSDFLWLYNALHSNNPGIIIPPPPEKQAVGRFDNNFVESRRMALERMLNRIASHPTLQQDADLKLFLESETFSVDIKHKEKNANPLATESKGFFGNAFSGVGPKFIETDEVVFLSAPTIQHS
jgi:sorting nexin-1/2